MFHVYNNCLHVLHFKFPLGEAFNKKNMDLTKSSKLHALMTSKSVSTYQDSLRFDNAIMSLVDRNKLQFDQSTTDLETHYKKSRK